MDKHAVIVDTREEALGWRDVVGYEGRYIVSSNGDIASIIRCSNITKSRRYSSITLWNGRKNTTPIHSIVARAFLGERPEGMEVDHVDGNRANNAASNLEYVTHRENINRLFSGRGVSSMRGVHRDKKGWRSGIRFGGKLRHIVSTPSEEFAAHAYRVAVKYMTLGIEDDIIGAIRAARAFVASEDPDYVKSCTTTRPSNFQEESNDS